MATPADLRNCREQLVARMILELQANRITLSEMKDWYGLFVFTGGEIPTGRYDLGALTSYLQRPFADDHILTGEMERYRHSVEAIANLGQGTAASKPRTLRCRKGMGEAFNRASLEMLSLGNGLELALARARC